jgi:polar amino acid transport system substrate-binding protein
MEQMMFAKSMVASTGNLTPYIVAAFYYLIVTLPLTKIIATFEQKLAAAEGLTAAPEPKKTRKLRRAEKAAKLAEAETGEK